MTRARPTDGVTDAPALLLTGKPLTPMIATKSPEARLYDIDVAQVVGRGHREVKLKSGIDSRLFTGRENRFRLVQLSAL